MIQLGEDYQRTNSCDQNLFATLARDAKGLSKSRSIADDLAALLADAA
ncbi:conserved hypothetical protein [Burkholderia sp. H160]|nr:conserved hypothetical protein [Burkholderia sp. H160]